jgi:two-component system sensor histidine kinase/response regulator
MRQANSRSDPVAESQPVRLSSLRALVGDNEAAARSILRSFSIHSGDIANHLRIACAAGNPGAAGDAAHKLKSAARAIGAFALADLCEDLEHAGALGDIGALAEVLRRFNLEEASVVAFLAQRELDGTAIL